MPKIKIQHSSSIPGQTAYQKLREFFEQDQDLKKMDPKMKATYDDGSRSGLIKGSQFTARVGVTDKGEGSTIDVEVEIPLLLTPLKGKIQETLEKKLRKYLA